MKRLVLVSIGLLMCALPVHAAELVPDTQTTVKAKVLEVVTEEYEQLPGTTVSRPVQKLRVEILEGSEKGDVITLTNDLLVLEQGETFYLTHTVGAFDGVDRYAVADPYRLPMLGALFVLFLIVLALFGGIQGVRGLVALCGGFILIIFLLLPGILHGYSPVVIGIAVAAAITVVGSYITHGFNRTTSAAVVGMLFTVLFSGGLAYLSVHWGRLNGYAAEESMYLALNSGGTLDLSGILLAGILIGLLGVLYDVAIGQAVAVEELHAASPGQDKRQVYRRALRIGREHIGALVNTLAIAYVGAALPLLLLFYGAPDNHQIALTINREIFATEIVRILVGSIGVVLAVPITTGVAVYMLLSRPPRKTGAHHVH